MVKNLLKRASQALLGLDNYLVLFSWLAGLRLRRTAYDPEFRYFAGLVPSDGIILDIGANIGIMTVALAKARPACQVYAFEPIPPNLQALRRIIGWYRLSNVQVFPLALGDQAGETEMILPEVRGILMPGLSHIADAGDATTKGWRFTVKLQKADELPALQTASKIVALKIDVENYEYFVLQGARAVLQKHLPLIYCELWDDDRRTSCISLLEGIGYKPMVFREDKLVAYGQQRSVNLFFIPPQQ